MSPVRLSRPKENGQSAADPQRTIPARANAQLAARVGLWALVGIGALGGLLGFVRPAAEPSSRSASAGDSTTVPPETAGYAELAVTAWVEASGDEAEAELGSLFSVDPSASSGDAGQRRVNGDATTVDARRVEERYWAVTVAAPVDEMVEGRWRAAGTWFVEIGIARTDEGLVAIGEPALVPAPVEPSDAPRPAGEGLGVPSQDDEEMAATVQGFLSALVAGDGDISRYLAPDVEVPAVTPAPFASITLQRWAVTETGDNEVRVRLAARATSAAGVPRTVSYELGLVERSGRWEVTSLSGAPTIEAPAAPASTTTTAADAATTTVSIAPSPGA